MFIGMQVTFLPMHLTGLMGMPRRVYTYLPGRAWEVTNMISTIGAFMFAAGVLIFLVELARNFRFTVDDDAGNVYKGGTLEWLPTGLYSTRSIPVVKSRYPLWTDPDICKDVEEGRYFLPNAPTGHRETIITSPIRAEPEYIQIMPGPSVWPFLAAVFTAGFFVILTIQAYAVAVFSGVLAVLCVLRWLWDTDRPVAVEQADVGAGIMLPTYVTGPRTHGWWAMIVLLIVTGMVFLMSVFSYFYLYGIHPEFWTVEADRVWLFPIIGLYALAAFLAWLGRRRLTIKETTLWMPSALLLWGMIAAGGAFMLDVWSWRTTGLTGDASGQGAIVHALLTLQGCIVFILALMGLYLAVRTSRALITTPRNNTFDLITLFTLYLVGQGAASALLTRSLPGGF